MGTIHIFKCYNHRFFKQKKTVLSNDLNQTYAQNIGFFIYFFRKFYHFDKITLIAQNFICEFHLLELPSDCALIMKCPHCKEDNFDNGLEMPIRCQKCLNFYLVNKKGAKKL